MGKQDSIESAQSWRNFWRDPEYSVIPESLSEKLFSELHMLYLITRDILKLAWRR